MEFGLLLILFTTATTTASVACQAPTSTKVLERRVRVNVVEEATLEDFWDWVVEWEGKRRERSRRPGESRSWGKIVAQVLPYTWPPDCCRIRAVQLWGRVLSDLENNSNRRGY